MTNGLDFESFNENSQPDSSSLDYYSFGLLGSQGALTIKKTGIYSVNASIVYNSTGGTWHPHIRIRLLNPGVTVGYSPRGRVNTTATPGNTPEFNQQALLPIKANWHVCLDTWQNSGAALNTFSSYNPTEQEWIFPQIQVCYLGNWSG